MDLFKEFAAALKNPFTLKSFYVIFVNVFIILIAALAVIFFLKKIYG